MFAVSVNVQWWRHSWDQRAVQRDDGVRGKECVFIFKYPAIVWNYSEKRVSRVPPKVVADNRHETEAPKGVNQKEFQALMKHLDELEQKEEEGDSSDE